MPFDIDTSFIGRFKIGDNMAYNADVLAELYQSSSDMLIKPKVVFNTSLIDAALYDFFRRVVEHTAEFQYLSQSTRRAIRETKLRKLDSFEKHINKFRHYQILGKDESLYQALHDLRTLRNRIHIQNEKGKLSNATLDEPRAFQKAQLELSEKCAEYVLRFLSTRYPRKDDYVHGIRLPWEPHFPGELKWK